MTDTTPEPHARVSMELNKADTREEVIGLALGAASVCWETPEGSGVFDSNEASLITKDTLARLAELDTPNLQKATTHELIQELSERWATFQVDMLDSYQKFLTGGAR